MYTFWHIYGYVTSNLAPGAAALHIAVPGGAPSTTCQMDLSVNNMPNVVLKPDSEHGSNSNVTVALAWPLHAIIHAAATQLASAAVQYFHLI